MDDDFIRVYLYYIDSECHLWKCENLDVNENKRGCNDVNKKEDSEDNRDEFLFYGHLIMRTPTILYKNSLILYI